MTDQTASSRLLTLVFTDIVDSTALKSSKGDFEAGELIARDREHVEAFARETGGRVIDWAGDGCFLTFETSSAAVLFGIKLQETHLENPELPRLRIGIHMGEVTERTKPDGTVRVEGLAVDITARIESLAHPDQVLISNPVYDSARQRMPRGKLVWKHHGEYQLKGFDESIEICEAGLDGLSPMHSPDKSEKAWPVGGNDTTSELASQKGAVRAEEKTGGDLRLLLRLFRRPTGILTFVVIAVGVVFLLTYLPSIQKSKIEANTTWARDVAIPDIRELVANEKFVDAYALALDAREYLPDDTGLAELIEQSTADMTFVSDYEGYVLWNKPYNSPESEWVRVASVPGEARIAVGMYRWKAEKEGIISREWAEEVLARTTPPNPLYGDMAQLVLPVQEGTSKPDDMAFVPASIFIPGITGVPIAPISLPEFFIDIHEVTNAQYQEFVDAGGYSDPGYWNEPFVLNGERLSFEEAMTHFKNTTGHPGPATWEINAYPDGLDEYPVSGVSWYEAMAYAAFVHKSLPTVYHWARATFSPIEASHPITPYLARFSNFDADADLAPVGSAAGLTTSGALDMAGNVREWCLNQSGEQSMSLGGKWDDPEYMINFALPVDSWDRDTGNGFRCMKLPEGQTLSESVLGDFDTQSRFNTDAPLVNDDVFEQYLSLFRSYDTSRPFDPEEEMIDDTRKSHTRYRITIQSYNDDVIPIYLDVPKSISGAVPVVVYFPGVNSLFQNAFEEAPHEDVSYIPKSGRILVKPVLTGMYERLNSSSSLFQSDLAARGRLTQAWAKDLSRVLDYLETREDVDSDAITYMGVSLGAITAPLMANADGRFKVMVLIGGGIAPTVFDNPLPAATMTITQARHVSIPVLLMNGRYDYLFPVEQSQIPYFEAFGAPTENKKMILYDAGHVTLPRAEVIKETLLWLDRFKV